MPRYSLRDPKRRNAAILFVVVVLLTLFLVIGLCFVLFADAQATSSRFYREANLNIDDKYPTPEELLGWSLGSLIYPNHDGDTPALSPGAGPMCAARGHELSRTMYGWNYQVNATNTDIDGVDNQTPYNGIGRPATTVGTTATGAPPWIAGMDDRLLINYVYYQTDGFKRNPERINVQQIPGTVPAQFTSGTYVGGFNPPYTAADLNNVYLADATMVPWNAGLYGPDNLHRSYTVEATKRSFWRGDDVGYRHPSLPNGMTALDPLNQAWTDPSYPGGPYNPPTNGYDSRPMKYLSLRPRPVDQLMPSEIAQLSGMTTTQAEAQIRAWATPGNNQRIFPLPSTAGGDVRNLPGPGQNDAVWIDLSFGTVRLAASQKKVKPMFAITIVDLDGRANVNIAGNVKESSQVGYGYHASNQGFGPWETNLRYLMPDTPKWYQPGSFPAGGDSNEYLNLLRGTVTAAGSSGGRYGSRPSGTWDGRYPQPQPLPPNQSLFPYPNGYRVGAQAGATYAPPNYSLADYDGSSVVSPNPAGNNQPPFYGQPALWALPRGADAGNPYFGGYYSAMPVFPNAAKNPGQPYGGSFQNGSFQEHYGHPSLFNPFLLNHPPVPNTLDEYDRLLPIGDMQGLIAWTTPPLAGLASDSRPFAVSQDTLNTEFAKLWPNHLVQYPRMRNLITTLSMDLDRAGFFPGQSNQTPYTLDGSVQPYVNRVPTGQPTSFSNLLPTRLGNPNPGGDLRPNDWRSILADLGRVNLNRALSPYPNPLSAVSPYNPAVWIDKNADRANYVRAWRADRDRVVFARDIFDRLRYATGAADPSQYAAAPPPATDQQFNALRYLAQLAVNIVDFIDSDDVITAFNFLGNQITDEPSLNASNPAPGPNAVPGHGWVFGTEMPRLVINEAYAQLQNDPNDPFNVNGGSLNYQRGAVSDPDTPAGSMDRPFQNINPPLKPTDMPKATKDYRVNFFVELHNPHNLDPNLSENGAGRLMVTTDPTNSGQKNIYKLVFRSQADSTQTRAVDNVTGQPMPAAAPAGVINLSVQDFSPDPNMPQVPPTYPPFDRNVAMPAQNNIAGAQAAWINGWNGKDVHYGDQTLNDYINNGYVLLGPSLSGTGGWHGEVPHDRGTETMSPNGTAPIHPTISVADNGPLSSQMWTSLTGSVTGMSPVDPATIAGGAPAYSPTVFLQRLAFPHLPPQPNPALGNYNPYVTIDYVEKVPIQDAVLYDTNGKRDGQMGRAQRQSLSGRNSYGRRQPFKATQLTKQAPSAAPSDRIQQTFLRQNGTGDNAQPNTNNAGGGQLDEFNWYVHYDRVPTSGMDLLNVSGFKPHELTQEFMNGGSPTNHQAPWRTPQTRLYRALELLSPQSFMNVSTFGGRIPGKTNINMMAGQENWQALCDALAPNPATPGAQRHYFDINTVNNTWGTLQQFRQNGWPIYSMGQPYGSNADAQFTPPPTLPPPTSIDGPERSMLMHDPNNPANPLLATSDAFPYNQEELLRKIAGSVTTRSNIFAIYITTAFFEVRKPQGPGDPDGDAYQPALLGREVDPRLRHKMFAVVDRTNLSMDSQNNNLRQQGARPIYFPLDPYINNASVGAKDLLRINVIPNTTEPTYFSFVPAFGLQNGNQLVVRDTIDHNGREYSGSPSSYSGETANIFPGMKLYLDVGPQENGVDPTRRMEVVIVQNCGLTTDPVTNEPRYYIQFSRLDGQPLHFTHARGAAISTLTPGNPGPQMLPIPYDDPPYSNTVVPYRAIIQ
jgi:hypothetical protein